MPLRRQTQVMIEMERMAGRALGATAADYRRSVVNPMIARMKKAKSLEGLLARLSAGLVREMDERPLAETLAEVAGTAIGIGAVSGTPRKHRKVETSKRETKMADS